MVNEVADVLLQIRHILRTILVNEVGQMDKVFHLALTTDFYNINFFHETMSIENK